MIRVRSLALALAAALTMSQAAGVAGAQEKTAEGFAQFVTELREIARRAGVSEPVIDAAFEGVTLNEEVVKFDRLQPEFSQPIWEYLDGRLSNLYLNKGKEAMRRYGETLAAIEQRYGVDAEVVAAIWGVESFYGARRGTFNVIEALATLAYEGRRSDFGKQQLVAALKILENGDVAVSDMVGSWAGAMGHTQFIPTSYQALAVDFGGDGQRNIWSDDPTDALASTANYLAQAGWADGAPWGFHVILPQEFDYSRYAEAKLSTSEWAAQNVTLSSGVGLPAGYDDATLLLPAGAKGATFLVLDNYRALLRYNNADAYALAVALLSERLNDRDPRRLTWPRGDQPLSLADRKEIQETLNTLGFDAGPTDGIVGAGTMRAIRRFQTANSMVADGYASSGLLSDLRRSVAARSAPLIRLAAGPATDADIREIQGLLRALGHLIEVDGQAGPQTRRALQDFIDERGVNLAAEPSKELLAELRRAVRKE